MKNRILERLINQVSEFWDTLYSLQIVDYNNPPEPGIDRTSREWMLFYDECQDFIEQFKLDIDMNNLKKVLEIKGDSIYEENLINIERELKRIERQTELSKSNEKKQMDVQKAKKIFISHSTQDEKYAKALVELLEGIRIGEDYIFCSSLREYGIKIGEDIYDRLKLEFNSYDLLVFFILSNNYYNSAASLNEMGAAWVLQKDYISILLPGFNFKDIKGAINPNAIGIRLEDEQLEEILNDLKDKLCEMFKISISQNHWERVRKEFIKKITSD